MKMVLLLPTKKENNLTEVPCSTRASIENSAFLSEDKYPGVTNVSCPQALAEEEKRAWYTLFTQVSQEFWEFGN